jgi:general secretion pathway protein H
MQARRDSGFTLIEILLVILLIGVLASMVVYNFQGESRSQRLQKETDKLQARIQLAAELAMLKNQELGIYLAEDSYRFMLFSDNKWLTIREPKALAEHQLPEGVRLTAELEGLEWASQNLLSDTEWREEDDRLSDGTSFDEMQAEKELKAAQEAAAKAAEQQGKDGPKKPLKRQTGIETLPVKPADPSLPTLFLLSSGEISPAEIILTEQSERPYLQQQLTAEFSIPLKKGEVQDAR